MTAQSALRGARELRARRIVAAASAELWCDRPLLSTSNPKTAKGESYGWLTAILHLAPVNVAGAGTVCPWATAGCAAVCLNMAGHGGIILKDGRPNLVQVARVRRTLEFRQDRARFLARLAGEIAALDRRARRAGLKLAVRLNGTSDLLWERFPVVWNGRTFPNLMRAFPRVTFYDYTKAPIRVRGERATGRLPRNYKLTFSLAESNDADAADALAAGVNVAAVFATRKGAPLPREYMGRRVIDADLTDLRFLDRGRGVIAGLRAKGPAKHDSSGFVRAAA